MFSIVLVEEAEDPNLVGKYAVRNDLTGFYLPNDDHTQEATFDTIEAAEAFVIARASAITAMLERLRET